MLRTSMSIREFNRLKSKTSTKPMFKKSSHYQTTQNNYTLSSFPSPDSVLETSTEQELPSATGVYPNTTAPAAFNSIWEVIERIEATFPEIFFIKEEEAGAYCGDNERRDYLLLFIDKGVDNKMILQCQKKSYTDFILAFPDRRVFRCTREALDNALKTNFDFEGFEMLKLKSKEARKQ